MLQNLTYRDIVEYKNRIKYCQIRLESLRRLGLESDAAEDDLKRAIESLAHLEHHRQVFEYSLRMCGLLGSEVVDAH